MSNVARRMSDEEPYVVHQYSTFPDRHSKFDIQKKPHFVLILSEFCVSKLLSLFILKKISTEKLIIMRKIIVEAEVSLDGVVNHPDMWAKIFKYHSEDVTDYLNSLLARPAALLLGRKTYQGFAQVWPERDGEMAKRINSMPKYVASRTLKQPLNWNSNLIRGDVVAEIRKLKQEPGNSLLQYGIGELTNTMLKNGLIDEMQLIVYPFTFGKGERWFNTLDAGNFDLLDCHSFTSGALLIRYRPNPD